MAWPESVARPPAGDGSLSFHPAATPRPMKGGTTTSGTGASRGSSGGGIDSGVEQTIGVGPGPGTIADASAECRPLVPSSKSGRRSMKVSIHQS